MAEPHVITALRAKRAEISGNVHDLERKLARHRASLAAIDATIRLYAPELDPDAIPPKRTYRRTRYFAKGELSRRVIDVLRQASGKPMTTAAITSAIVADKGFPIGEGALSEAVTDMVLAVLRRLSKRGEVAKSGTSRNAQWALALELLY
ncbi:MAG: hypothetical protein P4L80_01900 [Xanthobacteraceae bacterium]|nr:hypothetical protein [Xanthobacteraceae bacterium]